MVPFPRVLVPAWTAHRNRSGREWPVPEDSLDEFDPKEREEAVLAAVEPIRNTVVEDFTEGPDDEGDGAGEGEGDSDAFAAEGAGAPGEPARRRRRRRRRRGRSKGPAGADAPAGTEPSPEGAPRRESAPQAAPTVAVRGLVKLHGDHSGLVVSAESFYAEKGDPFLPKYLVESEDLEDGLLIEAEAVARGPKGPMVQKIVSIEGMTPAEYRSRYIQFHKGVSIDPNRRLRMETGPDENSGRVLDLVVPIGRGQRCLIVAPPKAGKTFLLKTMANAIAKNDPDVVLLMLLVDDAPRK